MKYLLILICLLLISCGEQKDSGLEPMVDDNFTETEVRIIEEIEETGHRILASPLEIPDVQLEVLDELANSRIVGLGEATHGTKEFFQMKHRIFQYLVERHNYTAFLFEMDVAEARIFNDWIQGKRDDNLSTLMTDKMLFWTWRTEEVRALLQWMKNFNEGLPPEDMLHFYGVDTQYPGYDVEQLADLLSQIGDSRAASLVADNANYIDIRNQYENGSDEAVATVIGEIKNTKAIITELQDQILNQLGSESLLWANQLVLHMEQVQQVVFDNIKNQRYYQRDKYMAENTSWYFDLLGSDSKMVLWAHNGHLADDFQFGGIYGGSQGSYLKKEYGEDYQIVAFSFAQGSFSAVAPNGPLGTKSITSTPKKGSYTAILFESDLNDFILSLSEGSPDLLNWYNAENSLLMLGAVFNGKVSDYYRTMRLSTHYDYIIHFDNTENSELLNF